jgi:hypothetical protein
MSPRRNVINQDPTTISARIRAAIRAYPNANPARRARILDIPGLTTAQRNALQNTPLAGRKSRKRKSRKRKSRKNSKRGRKRKRRTRRKKYKK